MPIRITGMNSGLDTESIITELIKVEQSKVDNIKKQQTKHQWKQDAWKSLNTKIFKLYNGTIANMRFSADYAKKTTDVSNSSLVSVVTSDSAMNATQKMQIVNKAQSGYMTGAEIGSNSSFTNSSKLAGDLGIAIGSTFSVTADGKTKDITVDADTTIGSVVSQLRSAGVEANFDEKYQRFHIASKKSGKNSDFSITASDTSGVDALQKMGIFNFDDKAKEEYEKYASLTGTAKQTVIDDEIARRLASYISQRDSLIESLDKQQENLDKLKAAYSAEFGSGEDITSTNINDVKDARDALKQQIEADGDAASIADKSKLAGLESKLAHLEGYEEAKTAYTNTETSLTNVKSYIDNGGNGSGASNKLITDVENLIENKINTANDILTNNAAGTSQVVRTMGSDAKIKLNGIDYESDSNTFEINGLTISVLGDSSEEITLSTRQDTDGIYTMIKDFLKEYNAIIKEIDTLYGAKKEKGYEPLTDEERDEMSEKEIEKWEQKIKDSVLSRDSNLSTISSALKEIMLGGATVNGQKMYLSNFGIETLGYFISEENEKSMYHIDGDIDDDNTKNNEDKLKAAIAADPDTVISFFAELSQSLYKELGSQMSSTDFRTFGSIYDDKKMKEDYDNYTTKIKDQEKKLKAMEDKWYNKFSAMETALARLQSNQSAVSGLLGGL